MTSHLFLIVMKTTGRNFPRTNWQFFLLKGEVWALFWWFGTAEFLNFSSSLLRWDLNLRQIKCWRWDHWKNSCCLYGTNLWKSSFLSWILSQPYCRKLGGFPKNFGEMGIGSEFSGIYLQELLLSLYLEPWLHVPWALCQHL